MRQIWRIYEECKRSGVNAFESMQGRNDRGQELHIYLEGDAKKLFKVIRQEGNNYQKQTGNPVFG